MMLTVSDIKVELREGRVNDVPLLLSFIRSMAEFEKLAVTATEQDLRTSLFGDQPAAKTLIAFVGDTPIGYATYFFTFSTMLGKRGLWLDDLFITPEFRGKGIGRAIMSQVATIAQENGCGRFEWIVLDWNEPAIRFYEKLGAEILLDWKVCRLGEQQITSVASGSRPPVTSSPG